MVIVIGYMKKIIYQRPCQKDFSSIQSNRSMKISNFLLQSFSDMRRFLLIFSGVFCDNYSPCVCFEKKCRYLSFQFFFIHENNVRLLSNTKKKHSKFSFSPCLVRKKSEMRCFLSRLYYLL